MTRTNPVSATAAMLRSRTVQNVGLSIGTAASALVLVSGIIGYPLIELAVYAPLGFLFVLIVGIWLGAIWPARLALGVGNGCVLAGFAGLLLVYSPAGTLQINPILFFGAALLFVFGYALIAVSLARGMLARRTRPA
jgi:hypothetical protein